MKEIAFIVHSITSKGGLERIVKIKSDVLSDIYECNLICMYDLGEPAYEINSNIKFFYLNKGLKRIRKTIIYNFLMLRKFVQENHIELIIIEGRSVNFIPLLLKIFSKQKIVFVDHGSLNGYRITKTTLKERFCNFIDQFLIAILCDKIVTLTEKEKSEYIKTFNISEQKIDYIYNFIDNELMDVTVQYNNNNIITVGRIDYQKGYEYLIEVAKLVFVKHPDCQWHIYGDGEAEYKNKIIDLIVQNNLQNHIILMGNRSDIYDLYQEYSFLVMTSRYEGFGMVLLEAKAKKLPLISFDINSGPSDIIRDGIDGFLIKPFDCEAMAEKICELIENPELRQKFSDNAHGNIDKFSKEKIIKQWCDLIDELS